MGFINSVPVAEPWTPPLGPGGAVPQAYIGFAEGHYWAGGQEVAVNDIIPTNDNYYGLFSYADITQGVGWSPTVGSGGASITGPARDYVVSNGATIVVEISLGIETLFELGLFYRPLLDPYFWLDLAATDSGSVTEISATGGDSSVNWTPEELSVGSHIAAATMLSTGISASIDGGAAIQQLHDWGANTPDRFGLAYFLPTNGGYVSKVVIYPVVANAVLPTYSV